MLESMNLLDKTRVAFAERFVLVNSSKNSECGVFCCRLQIHKASKRGKNFTQDFFIISLRKL